MKLHRVKTPTLKPAYIAALLPTGVAINYAGSLLRNMLSSTSKTGRKVNSHRMTTVIRQSEMSDTTRNSKKTRRLPKQSRQR